MTTSDAPGGDAARRARQMWRTLEPYHGIVYFTPHAAEQYGRLGIEGRDGYFASRGAALGPVSAEVVISTFYNFHPGLVRHAIPKVWGIASPAEILRARLAAADLALREVLGEDVDGEEVVEAATLAEKAARSASVAGRPLFAAHAALRWPDAAHLVLWHAITLLREHRGDGHIAALVTAGLDPARRWSATPPPETSATMSCGAAGPGRRRSGLPPWRASKLGACSTAAGSPLRVRPSGHKSSA